MATYDELLEHRDALLIDLAASLDREDAITKQRDGLLEAMQEVFKIAKLNQSTWGAWMRDHAQAAIAKVKS